MGILEFALAAQIGMSFGKRKTFFFQMDQAKAPSHAHSVQFPRSA